MIEHVVNNNSYIVIWSLGAGLGFCCLVAYTTLRLARVILLSHVIASLTAVSLELLRQNHDVEPTSHDITYRLQP